MAHDFCPGKDAHGAHLDLIKHCTLETPARIRLQILAAELTLTGLVHRKDLFQASNLPKKPAYLWLLGEDKRAVSQ